MKKFQILCVTMGQKNFSKIKEMNIHSDVVFANQANQVGYEELKFEGYRAQMITTNTCGVGKNRNIALMYADAEYCLFADDDVVYYDGLAKKVVDEFEKHKDADVFIFNLDSEDGDRKQVKYDKTRRCKIIEKMPWGCVRVAVKLEALKKANIWFTTLFGGGCMFPSGEDSLWLTALKRNGLKFYISSETIGRVMFTNSSWLSGYDKKYYFGKGAFYQAVHPRTFYLWMLYICFRTRSKSKISFQKSLSWIKKGKYSYINNISYKEL